MHYIRYDAVTSARHVIILYFFKYVLIREYIHTFIFDLKHDIISINIYTCKNT